MRLLLELMARSSFMVLIGLLSSMLLRNRSAALRHVVLTITLFAAVAVVPLTMVVPGWHPLMGDVDSSGLPDFGPLPEAQAVSAPSASAGRSEPPADSRHLVTPAVIAGMWAVGGAVSGMVLLAGIRRLRRIEARAERVQSAEWTLVVGTISGEYGLTRPVILLVTETPDLLATWGLLRPRVLLPSHAREWSTERREVVLRHELAHISRGDWLVQFGAEVMRTLFWFNPLVWAICTRLRRESEQACDDLVLAGGVPVKQYATELLELARTCRPYRSPSGAVTPMAHPSTLERRFAVMLNPLTDHRPASSRALAATAVLLLGLSFPVAAFRAGQTAPLPLAGAVYDPSGAVLPSVQLTLVDVRRHQWKATTDASGHFDFPQLEPGRYEIDVSLLGFRPLHHVFDLRTPTDWDRAITLEVGEVSEAIMVRAARQPGPAPAAPTVPLTVRVGGNIRTPRKLQNVPPVYPPAMRAAGREGVVPIEAVIGTDGAVHSVRVLSASIHPDFAVAAADAVRQWRFAPTLLNGVPVDVSMTVNIQFSLSD